MSSCCAITWSHPNTTCCFWIWTLSCCMKLKCNSWTASWLKCVTECSLIESLGGCECFCAAPWCPRSFWQAYWGHRHLATPDFTHTSRYSIVGVYVILYKGLCWGLDQLILSDCLVWIGVLLNWLAMRCREGRAQIVLSTAIEVALKHCTWSCFPVGLWWVSNQACTCLAFDWFPQSAIVIHRDFKCMAYLDGCSWGV